MRCLRHAVLMAALLVATLLLGGCGSKTSASQALSTGVLRVGT
jgi:hypothetical protein